MRITIDTKVPGTLGKTTIGVYVERLRTKDATRLFTTNDQMYASYFEFVKAVQTGAKGLPNDRAIVAAWCIASMDRLTDEIATLGSEMTEEDFQRGLAYIKKTAFVQD